MLINFFIFILISIVFFLTGFGGIQLIKILFKKKELETNFFHLVLFGLVILTFIIRSTYFFFPVTHQLLIVMTVLSMAIFLKFKKEIMESVKNSLNLAKYQPINIAMFVFLGLFISYKTTFMPVHYDVNLYHANLIRWIENYKVIPGLANLHSRFGFIGSWHFLSALTSFSSFFPTPLHLMNGWLVCFFALFFTKDILKNHFKKVNLADLFKIFLLFFLLSDDVIKLNISSPITDIPVTVIIWIVFILLADNTKKNIDITNLNLILLPFFLVSIKLSAIPLLLVSVIKLFSKKTANYVKKTSLALIILLLGIMFSTNIFISGHLLYPIPQLSFNNLEWTVSQDVVRGEMEWVKSWAIQPGVDKDEVFKKTFLENISIWFVLLNKKELTMVVIIFILLLLTLKKVILEEKIYFGNKQLQVFFISSVGVTFWFFTAPDFRFVYGYLLFFIFSLISLYFQNLKRPYLLDKGLLLILQKLFLVVVISSLISSMVLKDEVYKKLNKNFIFSENYREMEVEKVVINDMNFYIPYSKYGDDQTKYGGDQTGWNGFPGTPAILDGFYTLGDSYEDGFAIDKSLFTN